MNVASVKTGPIKDFEMDSEQEVVRGNNNGLHWVNALMSLKNVVVCRFGRGKPFDLVGIKTLQAGKQRWRETGRKAQLY